MLLSPANSWKLVLAIALFAAVVTSARARPPRRAVSGSELRWLVVGALALYGVGAASSLTHHITLAVALYSCGIGVSALAAWLSRAQTGRGPSPDQEPVDEPPPPPPDGAPEIDWASFERQFEAYVREQRTPVKTG